MDPDDALLTELRALAGRMDPLPASLHSAASAAFAWRTIDSELAELTSDSAADDKALAGVRADGGPRLLTFEASDIEVEVEVAAVPGGRRVIGQIVPPQRARVEVRHATGTVVVEADELGRFSAYDVPAGPVSVRCLLGAGERPRVVATDWLAV